MDRLTSMAVFIRAVDLGSFAKAAEALGLSAPMVGKHVRFLEERLGVHLINRTTRRQSLTDFGRSYYERCRLILAEVEAADVLAANQLSEPRGLLRVTAPVHFGRHCVMPILMALVDEFPELQLDLSLSDRFVDLAEDGYDLAVRTGDPGNQAGISGRRVARQRMIVCGSPRYLETARRPTSISDLQQLKGIVYLRSGIVPPWMFPRDGDTPLEVLPSISARMDDLAAIADAVTCGAGLAWLPSWLVRDRLVAGSLIELLPDLSGFPYDVSALWLSTSAPLPKVRIAIDALARELPKYMGHQ
ncbi:DNA-binding transcriptional LysR family regulator [Rhizobium sp. BK313]|uniref:LysR family transcriptional regulator n=1 Tax=Rhizobium sp. BK313 TaxID=2587081 RepID=UPI0010621F3C|nr:LysR family transcriptional regulator [Rhizobium sp. BK313]MBB3455058.1 DNA-binding transcriptional LysR family regulator [Rhizobium sp. BK313]